LPNCFSIWLSARSSALLLISIAIAFAHAGFIYCAANLATNSRR
jgi:hypothetical protein